MFLFMKLLNVSYFCWYYWCGGGMHVIIIDDYMFWYISLIYSNPIYIYNVPRFLLTCRCVGYVMFGWSDRCLSCAVIRVANPWLSYGGVVACAQSKSILCSKGCCSVTNRPILWYSWTYIASQQFMCLPFLHAFTICMVSSWGPYSCLLFKMCKA